jgi:hypothetical protein
MEEHLDNPLSTDKLRSRELQKEEREDRKKRWKRRRRGAQYRQWNLFLGCRK